MKRTKCWRNILPHECEQNYEMDAFVDPSSSSSSLIRQIFTLKFKDRPLNRNVYHYLVIVIATVVCYWPSVYGELVFDDKPAIVDNKDVRWSTSFYRLFLNDYWGISMQKELSHKSYRPLTVLTFRLNYLLHGLNPIGFHIVNIALHAFASILVHKLCLRFESNSKIAFTSAMVFAMHPIHTDAVASVVGRSELLSAIFYECSLLTYLSGRNGGHSSLTSTSKLNKLLLTVSLACVGLLCKEQCLTVLIVCAAFEMIAEYRKTCAAERRNRMKNITILFCGFIFALLLRVKLNGKQLTPRFNRYDNPASVANTDTKLFTYTYLCAYNFWLLTFPFQLCCDWTHESIKLLTSLMDARNVITVAFFSTLIYVFSMPFLRKKVPEEFTKIVMFVIMTVIPFVPASNLFFTTGFVVAERVLYLPSVGFALLIAFGVKRLNCMYPNATFAAVIVLLFTFGVKTYSRCNDWQNELSLFKSGLTVNPRNVKLLNNVGRLLERRSQFNDAIEHYKKCIELEPMDIRGFLNLGNLYSKINEFEKAEIVYRKGKRVVEKDAFSNRRITALHITLLLRLSQLLSKDASKEDQRKKVHEKVLLLSALSTPYLTHADRKNTFYLNNNLNEEMLDSDDLYNLAIITQENGAILDALRLFDLALQRYPHHESSLLASARIIYEQRLREQYSIGIERLQRVIEMGKASDVVYFQLGMLSIKSADYEMAAAALSTAIELNANFSEALYNLALLHYNRNALNASSVMLHRLLTLDGEHTKGTMLSCDIQAEYYRDFYAAERCYRKVLAMDADNATVKHNICVILVHTLRAASVSVCLERRLWSDATLRDQEMRRNNKSSVYLF